MRVRPFELSAGFGVSEETIRRDLDKLDRQGLAIKSYGGGVLNENSALESASLASVTPLFRSMPLQDIMALSA